MIDKVLLAPYYCILKLRHFLYDHEVFKTAKADVPTVCIGNVTVGGTGKTPHTEMLIRLLTRKPGRNVAVLSRGYRRKSKGFQLVTEDGTADMFGDEPLQIKKKFPQITVAVDKSRVEGCRLLSDTSNGKRKPDVILLDDAFQHRALKPTLLIVLVDWSRPVYSDSLLPIGHLRDLPERIEAADIIIVTKCPQYLDGWEKSKWASALKISKFDTETCLGSNPRGKKVKLYFTTIGYDEAMPVWPAGNPRYVHSPRLVLFSGIANDTPLRAYLSSNYKIVKHLIFGDHCRFGNGDIRKIESAAKDFPTAVVMTTEKDSQRILSKKLDISPALKEKMFYTPIKSIFLGENDERDFLDFVEQSLKLRG